MTHLRTAGVLGALVLGSLSLNAQAAQCDYTGSVDAATGALAALTPPGTPVAGPIQYEDAAVTAGLVGPGDILSIDVNVGGFCFSTGADTSGCPISPSSLVPITSIDGAAITFDSLGPTGGTLDVTAFSPSFMVSIPIMFDLTAGTFFANAGALGTASGTFAADECILPTLPPEIEFSSPDSSFNAMDLSFDLETEIGIPDSATLTITNVGGETLTVDIGALVGAGGAFAVVYPPGGCMEGTTETLTAGETCDVEVAFTPTTDMDGSDSFVVTHNDMGTPGTESTITLNGTVRAPNIVFVTPASGSLSFTSTAVGETLTRTVRLTNNGELSLDITAISAPGDTQFTVPTMTDMCTGASLITGAECTFQVLFAPDAVSPPGMPFMTSLEIASTDPDGPLTMAITGTAVMGAVAEFTLDQSSVDFPDVLLVGVDTDSSTVRVTSTGTADLEVLSVEFDPSSATPDDFDVTNGCEPPPTVYPRDAFCEIDILFDPLTGGDKSASLVITTNADMPATANVSLSGSAFDGPRIVVEPLELQFGSSDAPVDIGSSATAMTTVSNTGNEALDITIDFDPALGEFTVAESSDPCYLSPIAVDGSCTITVQFAPIDEPDEMATMLIESTDTSNTPVAVSLTGFVFRGPRIGVAALTVDVDGDTSVEVGQSSGPVDIVIESTGTEPLVVDMITNSNMEDFSITEDCTTAMDGVPSGESCTITAVFEPASSGTKTSDVTITSNDITFLARRGASATTVIRLTGTAVDPPPPPAPPRTDPPDFAQRDVGGVGSLGLGLVAVGLGLWLARRRRDGVALASAAGAAVVLAALAPTAGHAISFENQSGNIYGSFDTTVTWGAAYRLQAPADNLIGLVNGGSKFSVNGDDGTLNFSRGIYSNALKLTSELELNYGPWNLGLFVRGSYFYDFEIKDGKRERTPLNPAALDKAGSDGDVLDAFLSWKFDIGDRPAEFRVGEQVINWGESTFIQGGANVINHINVSALRLPGSELREALLPQDLAFFSIGLTPNLDFEIVYQYDWDDTEPDPAGTFFSTNDFAVDGGSHVRLGFGDTPDTPNPPFFDLDRPFNAIPRAPGTDPSDDGQWGWAVRYFAPDFNNGTEFGFYYYNYHSRLPLISARTGSFEGFALGAAMGAPAGAGFNSLQDVAVAVGGLLASGGTAAEALELAVDPSVKNPAIPDYAALGVANQIINGGPVAAWISAYATDAYANTPSSGMDAFGTPAGGTSHFFTSFPEDIQLYAFSWNTTLGQTAWQGEIAHHRNRPLQIDDLELLFAGLSPLRAEAARFGQLGSFSFSTLGGQFNPDTPPLTPINGYRRRDYTQANMAFTRLFGPMLGADQGVLLFEVAFHHVHGFPDKSVLRFDGPATVVSGNDSLIPALGITLAEFAHPGKPIEPANNFPDADSWGYRVAGRLDFSNFIGPFNMSPRFAWQHDVDGITPGPAGAFVDGRKAINLGTRFSYQNRWEFDLSYSRFFGGGKQNEIHDRDFMAASVKYTF